MSAHISDDLPRLLTGDATRDVVLDAAEHLRSCPDCQQELVSAVVAHASLTSAHRFAPEIVAAGLDSGDGGADVPAGSLPDLSAVFSQVRQEAAQPTARPKRRLALVAVAAAAAVVVGGGVTVAVVSSGTDQPASRSVALAPVGATRATAKATIIGSGRMKIDATALPKLDSTHQYEVWLTDNLGVHKQPVGFIGNDNRADITVPSRVMSQYSDIAVSIQGVDQTEYSGNTVVLGSYA
jgi:hypothetical protein